MRKIKEKKKANGFEKKKNFYKWNRWQKCEKIDNVANVYNRFSDFFFSVFDWKKICVGKTNWFVYFPFVFFLHVDWYATPPSPNVFNLLVCMCVCVRVCKLMIISDWTTRSWKNMNKSIKKIWKNEMKNPILQFISWCLNISPSDGSPKSWNSCPISRNEPKSMKCLHLQHIWIWFRWKLLLSSLFPSRNNK